jgi:prefoldin subunit 5
MTDFGGVDYTPELFAIQDEIESIDVDTKRINAAVASIRTSLQQVQANTDVIEARVTLIRNSIAVFEDLGTNCNKGIKLVRNDDRLSRALTMMSLKDSNQLEEYRAKLDDPGYTAYNDLITTIFGE